METAFLQTFVLVAETGSMAEAARRLSLTPAAVAQQVKALEKELGTSLVARSGRTVLPTPAGHRLAGRAAELLRDVQGLHTFVHEDVVAGELRLGAINTALHTLLPDMLARLARAHPGVTVRIHSMPSQDLVEEVRRGELDAAVCLQPDFALGKSVGWQLLREEAFVVLARPELAQQGAHELLATQPLLRYDRAVGAGKQADDYLRRHGIVPHERLELTSLLAIALMVHEGLGVSLVPDAGTPLTAGLAIARVPLPGPMAPRKVGVLWRRGGVRARRVAAFLEQARRP